jgi:hypothetical protein
MRLALVVLVIAGCSGSVDTAEDTDAEVSETEVDSAIDTAIVIDTAVSPDTRIDAPIETTPDTPPDTSKPLCDGFSTLPFDVPDKCDAASGSTTTEIPANRIYAASWFGCYRRADGTIYKDSTDNCEFACGPKGLCPATMSGPECEANLKWFAADSDRYTCGGRIRITNCVNGKSVVVATLDRGPNCSSVEKAYGAPVLDMSHPAMVHLFDGKTYGVSDKKRVIVEKVDITTPLGPV